MKVLEESLGGYGWAIEVFIIVFLALLINFFIARSFKNLMAKFAQRKKVWEEAFIIALNTPLRFLVWLLGLTFALDITSHYAQDIAVFELIKPVRIIGVVLFLVWFLTSFIKGVEKNLLLPRAGKQKMDQTTVTAIGQLMRVSVFITAGLITLQSIGIPVSGVVAFGGIGGIAVGFAAKDLLANFFGGLMIFLDRPFSIGDWIRSPDREIEGTVEHIGWRTTRIRTFNKQPLFVPNSLFSTISVQNPSRMHNRRIRTNIGVRYDDAPKIRTIVKEVEEMLKTHGDIAQDKTIMVYLVNFAPSALEFMVYCFTKTTNWQRFQEVQQDVFLKIIDVITANGAECAFPTTTLHAPNLESALDR